MGCSRQQQHLALTIAEFGELLNANGFSYLVSYGL